jgi:hypothetical protein
MAGYESFNWPKASIEPVFSFAPGIRMTLSHSAHEHGGLWAAVRQESSYFEARQRRLSGAALFNAIGCGDLLV